jgi:hypothetical protein
MSGYVGSDPHRVELLGAMLLVSAEWLEDIRSRLTGALNHSTWEGYDAHEARLDWSVAHAPAIGMTAEMLRNMSRVAYENARAQWHASEADHGVLGRLDSVTQVLGSAAPASSLLDFMNDADLFFDIAGGIAFAAGLVVALPVIEAAGLTYGILGLPFSAFQLGAAIAEGDAGGIVLSGLSVAVGLGEVVLVGAALTGAIIISAPVDAAVLLGLGVASIGLAVASNVPAIHDFVDSGVHWVGDGVSSAWDAGVGITTSAVGAVADGVGDLAGAAVDVAKDVYDFLF